MTRKGLSQCITWACNLNDKKPTTQKRVTEVLVSVAGSAGGVCAHTHTFKVEIIARVRCVF